MASRIIRYVDSSVNSALSDALAYVDSFGDGCPDMDDYGSLNIIRPIRHY